MKSKKLICVAALVLFAATAKASTKYVNGVTGSDSDNCESPTTACKTIGHAIAVASSGDSIIVASATYYENLSISISLSVIGSGARTTIINGRCVNTVVTISNASAIVTLSNVTISAGCARNRGGILPRRGNSSRPLHGKRVDFLGADIEGEQRRTVRGDADLGTVPDRARGADP